MLLPALIPFMLTLNIYIVCHAPLNALNVADLLFQNAHHVVKDSPSHNHNALLHAQQAFIKIKIQAHANNVIQNVELATLTLQIVVNAKRDSSLI